MPSPPPPPETATAAQLGADINSGRTGDKTPGLDPAAAPLGVDEEAAGTPLTPRDWALARAQETAHAAPIPAGAAPEKTPAAGSPATTPIGKVLLVAAGIGAGLAVVTWLLLAAGAA